MLTETIFPFTMSNIRGLDYLIRDNCDKSWFESNITVRSKTRVTFTLFDIKDSFYGGRGDIIDVLKLKVDGKLLKPLISRRLDDLAAGIYFEEEEKKELDRIEEIKQEIIKTYL